MNINYVIPCLLGVESLIADEMRSLGAGNVTAENGRVLFDGDEYILARANICSHFAERIQILVGTFEARSFEELFQGTKSLPWEEWIAADDAFPVTLEEIKSELDPKLYVGRSVSQVEEFLADIAKPVIDKYCKEEIKAVLNV